MNGGARTPGLAQVVQHCAKTAEQDARRVPSQSMPEETLRPRRRGAGIYSSLAEWMIRTGSRWRVTAPKGNYIRSLSRICTHFKRELRKTANARRKIISIPL